jgi:hypothetical protein
MSMATKCRLHSGEIDVGRAIEVRDRRGSAPYPEFRCIECGQLVRPHKAGTTGQGAHFEHRIANPNCNLSG